MVFTVWMQQAQAKSEREYSSFPREPDRFIFIAASTAVSDTYQQRSHLWPLTLTRSNRVKIYPFAVTKLSREYTKDFYKHFSIACKSKVRKKCFELLLCSKWMQFDGVARRDSICFIFGRLSKQKIVASSQDKQSWPSLIANNPSDTRCTGNICHCNWTFHSVLLWRTKHWPLQGNGMNINVVPGPRSAVPMDTSASQWLHVGPC